MILLIMSGELPLQVVALEEIGRRFVVDLFYRLKPDSRCEILGATLHLFNEDQSFNWKFEVNLESFEVLDGIARIALLSADKLATAIAINREPNQVIPDNGTFLVDLVIGLVEDYLAKIRSVEMDLSQGFTLMSVDVGPPSTFLRPLDGQGLREVLEGYRNNLQNMVSDLEAGSEFEMVLEAERAVRLSDDLLAASTIYLELIQPLWVQVRRGGHFDLPMLERWKNICNFKLTERKSNCSSVFASLLGF